LSKPFRSDKRKKELQRLKKQEEKRLRRFGLIKQEGDPTAEGEVIEGETIEGGSEITEAGSDESETAHSVDTSSEDEQSATKQITE
jgi:hypothetical protein